MLPVWKSRRVCTPTESWLVLCSLPLLKMRHSDGSFKSPIIPSDFPEECSLRSTLPPNPFLELTQVRLQADKVCPFKFSAHVIKHVGGIIATQHIHAHVHLHVPLPLQSHIERPRPIYSLNAHGRERAYTESGAASLAIKRHAKFYWNCTLHKTCRGPQ